jgi:pimeloyl-ACP methyl ester carboxylesterase
MSISESLGDVGRADLPGVGAIAYRASGRGRPVVFAHGVGVNGDLWRNVAPPVAAAGYHCVVPDLPLGAHSMPLEGAPDMSLPGLADILYGFIEALGLHDVVLVANDTGGAITQALIGRRPERITGLVLTSCDAFDRYPPPAVAYLKPTARIPGGLWALGQAVRFRPVQRLPIAYGWATSAPIERRIMESYTRNIRLNAGVRADLARVLKQARKSDMEAASRSVAHFRRPALVVWAADDRFFPVEHGRALADLMPNARLELVEHSRTFIPEDQPEELVRLVLRAAGLGGRDAA